MLQLFDVVLPFMDKYSWMFTDIHVLSAEVVKDKVTQLKLSAEAGAWHSRWVVSRHRWLPQVKPDASKVQRSRTTGGSLSGKCLKGYQSGQILREAFWQFFFPRFAAHRHALSAATSSLGA